MLKLHYSPELSVTGLCRFIIRGMILHIIDSEEVPLKKSGDGKAIFLNSIWDIYLHRAAPLLIRRNNLAKK
jgi:hypothetical protein